MKRFRFLVVLLAFLLASSSAFARNMNERQVIMALTEVATGAPVSVTISNPNHLYGYLIVKTENETASASLVVTALLVTELGDMLICTSSAVLTDTTVYIALGGGMINVATGAVEEGIGDRCEFPTGRRMKYTFTVTGAGADFDVTADMEWLQH